MRTLETIALTGSLFGCSQQQSFYVKNDVPVHDTGDTETGIALETASPEDTAPPYPWVDSFVQPIPPQTDAVFVVDTSCSMQDDYDSLEKNFAAFRDAFPDEGGDWLVGMTVTNLDNATLAASVSLGPESTGDDFLALYNTFPKDDPYGNIPEQGFASFEAYIGAATWLRPDATLFVGFFSDENDQSPATSDSDAAASFESYLLGLRDETDVTGIVSFPPEDSLCNVYDWMISTRYIQVVQDLGGTLIDICSEDWTSGIEEVSNNVATFYTEYQLRYTPFADTIIVRENGELLIRNGDWEYYPPQNKIRFLDIPEGGAFVEMAYDINTEYDIPPY